MANSPGGVEEGRVAIRVVPDDSKFPADLRAMLERVRREVSLKIPVELDTSGLVAHAKAATAEAQAAAGDVKIKVNVDKKSVTGVTKVLNALGKSLSTSFSALTKGTGFAALGLEAGGAVPHVLALAGSLEHLVGVVALLPAGISGAVTVFGTLALGLHGFTDALKNIGDAKKFNEAIKGLAPSARDAAKAIKDLMPQFHRLQQGVQQHLFAGLNADIKTTAHALLPILNVQLRGVADSLNLIIHNSFLAFQNLAASGKLTTTFRNIKTSLDLIAPAIGAFIEAFGTLAAIGSPFLVTLAGDIQVAAIRFRDFLNTPKGAQSVTDFISSALHTFGQLFSVIKSTAQIFQGFITAAQAAVGSDALGGLATNLQNIATAVNSPAFQKGLTQLFQGFAAGSKALNAGLGTLAPALAAIVPLVAVLAGALGTVLGGAIAAVAPALTILLQALVPQLIAGLMGVVPILLKGFQAIEPVLTSIATTIAANKPLLAGLAIAAGALVGPFTAAAVAILLVVANFQAIKDFVVNTIIPIFFQVVSALQPTISAFQGLGQSILVFGAVVLPILQSVLAIIVQNWPQISAIVVQVFSTVQTIVVAVLTSLRIQIEVFTAVIAVLWGTFGGVILSTISHVFPAILTIIQGVLNIIQGIFRFFTDVMKGNWSALWSDVVQILKGVWQVIEGIFKAAFFTLLGDIRIGLAQIVAVFKTLGSLILGIIPGLASTLFDFGKALVLGIIRGIGGSAFGIADALKGAVGDGLKAAAKKFGIGSPSRVFAKEIGEPISQGIAMGVTKAAPAVSAAVVAATTPPDLAGGTTGPGGAGGSGRSGPAVNIENLTVADVEAMAKALAEAQRDAAVVENLQDALVGG